MSGPDVVVIVTPLAAEVSAAIGPYAWVVLEHLAARTDPALADGRIEVSTRDIAHRRSLSKDTVTRALARLEEAGLIERIGGRDAATGQFGKSLVRVHLERAGLRVVLDEIGRPETDRPESDRRLRAATPMPLRPTDNGAQLSLLDAIDGRPA